MLHNTLWTHIQGNINTQFSTIILGNIDASSKGVPMHTWGSWVSLIWGHQSPTGNCIITASRKQLALANVMAFDILHNAICLQLSLYFHRVRHYVLIIGASSASFGSAKGCRQAPKGPQVFLWPVWLVFVKNPCNKRFKSNNKLQLRMR